MAQNLIYQHRTPGQSKLCMPGTAFHELNAHKVRSGMAVTFSATQKARPQRLRALNSGASSWDGKLPSLGLVVTQLAPEAIKTDTGLNTLSSYNGSRLPSEYSRMTFATPQCPLKLSSFGNCIKNGPKLLYVVMQQLQSMIRLVAVNDNLIADRLHGGR